ncbi:hypothetical protein C6P45_000323 [Maudiozyma exigua]|uniref:Uncharacterized protein n=1 Tax=Maudiozyma exigua TaxID=34358 RepID=A0A9P6W939_MAUEX|nr:hypothetical protein C6P45_000323 [Kazachstania exigua]
MSTNMKNLDKENEVGPTTPKTLMKKQLYHGNNHVGNVKPNRSQARRVKRLPLASKDSNRTNSGISFNKNDSKGLSRNSSIHLKKYGSILYQGNNSNINNSDTLSKNSLPKVKSLVLKDIDDNDNDGNSSTGSDTDEDIILQSIKQGLSQSNKGLSALLEENEMKTNDLGGNNDDLDIEFAPLREKEIEYIPDGIDVLQIEDLKKLNDINIEPMTFDLGLDQDDGPNKIKGSLLMDLQSVSDYDDNDNDIGMLLQPHTHRDKRHNRTDIEIDTSDIDSIYHGHGLDADDIADLLAD